MVADDKDQPQSAQVSVEEAWGPGGGGAGGESPYEVCTTDLSDLLSSTPTAPAPAGGPAAAPNEHYATLAGTLTSQGNDLVSSAQATGHPKATAVYCRERDTNTLVPALTGLSGPPAGLLAIAAHATLTAPPPALATSPPRSGTLLPGIPTWFWAEALRPISATAATPGLSATVTASPTQLVIAAAGTELARCAGSGLAWTAAGDRRDRSAACTHVFQTSGTRDVTATVTWSATWVASNGETGTLPDLSSTGVLPLAITAVEAVTD